MTLGKIIKANREEKHLTQEKLCSGICTRSTLARIEAGKTMPTKFVAESLLQRLQLITGELSGLWYSSDIEQSQLIMRINELIRLKKYDMLIKEITELEDAVQKNLLFYQFLLKAKAIYLLQTHQDGARTLLIHALKITHPNYCDAVLEELLLTKQEIEIVSILASTYYKQGEYENAVYILKKTDCTIV